MAKKLPWLRLYRSVLHDRKVQRLEPAVFKAWINILCMAGEGGELPSVPDMAFDLRVQERKLYQWVGVLISAGLIDEHIDEHSVTLSVHNWFSWQFPSDNDQTAAARKRRQRQKNHKNQPEETAENRDNLENVTRDTSVTNRDSHGPCHGQVTPLDTDTDKDTLLSNSNELASRGARTSSRLPPEDHPSFQKSVLARQARGNRWPPEAVVPDDWLMAGQEARLKHHLPPIDLHVEAAKFANFWASKSGAGATKLDWKKTWINWTISAKAPTHGHKNSRPSQLDQLLDIAANGLAGGLHRQ